MRTYTVNISASYNDTVEVEANSEEEASVLGLAEFDRTFGVVGQGFSMAFDYSEVESVEE